MKTEKPEQKGGYNLKLFIDGETAKNFICAICKNVLRNAVQIPQSNDPKRACQDCYKDNIRYVSTSLMLYACFFSSILNILHLCNIPQLTEI